MSKLLMGLGQEEPVGATNSLCALEFLRQE